VWEERCRERNLTSLTHFASWVESGSCETILLAEMDMMSFCEDCGVLFTVI
jgi:hypothetical protein